MNQTEKEYLKKVGLNIARIRREKNLSQLDVCAILSMDKPNLSSIENGRQNPTTLMLKKIADVLEVEVKCFFEF